MSEAAVTSADAGAPARARRAVPGPGLRGAGPVLTAVAALVVLLAGTGLGAARAVLHQCVHLGEPLALLGLRLTLLQDAADCPTGTLAVAPSPAHGAVLALGLALPVVAAHAALGALGAGLAALLLRVARTARRVLGAVAHALPAAVRLPASRPVRIPAWSAGHALPAVLARARHPHRGPPPALA
jgi:hypothetical protein